MRISRSVNEFEPVWALVWVDPHLPTCVETPSCYPCLNRTASRRHGDLDPTLRSWYDAVRQRNTKRERRSQTGLDEYSIFAQTNGSPMPYVRRGIDDYARMLPIGQGIVVHVQLEIGRRRSPREWQSICCRSTVGVPSLNHADWTHSMTAMACQPRNTSIERIAFHQAWRSRGRADSDRADARAFPVPAGRGRAIDGRRTRSNLTSWRLSMLVVNPGPDAPCGW